MFKLLGASVLLSLRLGALATGRPVGSVTKCKQQGYKVCGVYTGERAFPSMPFARLEQGNSKSSLSKAH